MNELTYDKLMIHYGELSLKGKNRKHFIDILLRNIKHALKHFSALSYVARHDHTYISLNGENPQPILNILADISGIHAISPVIKTSAELDEMAATALEIAKSSNSKTFKIIARRTDKSYPYKSDYINRYLASKILSSSNLTVDVHNPELPIKVEIKSDGAYFLGKQTDGVGGLPLGSGGKVLMMLSGGIDSPVAAYHLMRRGIEIEAIHFATPPYTSNEVINKLKDLLHVLNKFQPRIRLHVIYFTPLHLDIFKNASEGYPITIMRRMFYRISSSLALKRRLPALASGESLGQVSSQTLASLRVINEVTSIPVIRPLATYDKQTIINEARRIGTYDISIRPFEDACTIFAPVNPKTAPRLKEVQAIEAKWDYQSQIDECLKTYETIIITDEKENDFF